MKKCFVFLFPEIHFFETCSTTDKSEKANLIAQFRKIAYSRYYAHNYDIHIIKLKDSQITGFEGMNYRITTLDKTFDDICHNRGLINFEELAHKFSRLDYDKVVVGGFFLGRAVDRFAKGLIESKREAKVCVDLDMTEFAWAFTRDNKGGLSRHFDDKVLSNQNSCQTLVDNFKLSKSDFENMMLYNKLPCLYKAPYNVDPNRLEFFTKTQEYNIK